MNKNLNNSITSFLNLFEEVFDRDWEYSKEMMGISDETEEQKLAAKEIGLESIEIISNEGTFINPKVKDEIENWGNRGALLREYRILKEFLKNE